MAQPSNLSEDTYLCILERISSGELVTDVCKELGICRTEVWRASEERDTHTSLASPSAYMRARVSQMHSIAEDTILIADGRDVESQTRMRAMVDTLAGVDDDDKARLLASLQSVAVQRDTLRVNTRKFLMAKIAPKIYGEPTKQVELSGPGGGPIAVEDVSQLRDTLTARLAGIASRRKLLTATVRVLEAEDVAAEVDPA